MMNYVPVRFLTKIGVGILLVLWLCAFAWGAERQSPETQPYASGELLVKFQPGTGEVEKEQVRQLVNAVLIKEIKVLHVEYWALPKDMDPRDAAETISAIPVVEYAEPNYYYSPQKVPSDTYFNRLWYLNNTGQTVNGKAGISGADISAEAVWDLETGSADIVIAVIDSGVAFDHPDLTDNIWSNPGEIPDNSIDDDDNGYVDDIHGWDFVNNDNNPSDYSKDLYGNGHGTHVAGIIAAEGNNGTGITGIMWQARIMPVQIFDLFEASPFNATTRVVAEALLYAVANGAKIINCSFGGPSFSQTLYAAYGVAEENGVLIVAAAGNDARDNDDVSTFPANYDLDNIISVAATDENDLLASYSNYGRKSVDVAAPGGSGSGSNIFSTTPPEREVMFSDDFESGAAKWVTAGKYEPWTIVFSQQFNSMVITDSVNDYHENEFSYIRTADPISAVNFRGLNLQFSVSYGLGSRFDALSSDVLIIELSEGESGVYDVISSLNGFSLGVEQLALWSNDTNFDDFYLRFSLNTDQDANYDGVYIDDISLTGIDWKFTGDEYGYKSGTSMATPVVAGVAGLVWSADPDLTYRQVKEMIMDTVDLLPDLAGRVVANGRVNAAAAVQAAIGDTGNGDTDNTNTDTGTGSSGSGGGCFISSMLS